MHRYFITTVFSKNQLFQHLKKYHIQANIVNVSFTTKDGYANCYVLTNVTRLNRNKLIIDKCILGLLFVDPINEQLLVYKHNISLYQIKL